MKLIPNFLSLLRILLVFPITRKVILSRYSKKYSSKKEDHKKNYIDGEYEDIEDKDGK